MQCKTKFGFQRNIKEMEAWHEIPEDLITNFDQTPLPYICTENHSYAKKGSSNVPLVRKIKKQFTGTFTITMSRSFLPTQLICKGTTNRCLPKGADFPSDFDATCTVNQSSNESKAIQHLKKIVFPFFEKWEIFLWIKRQCSNLIFFEGHVIEKVASIFEENKCVIIYVSNKLTDQFQPLELTVRS